MTRWVAWLGALVALAVGAALFAGVGAATSSAWTTVGQGLPIDDAPVALLPEAAELDTGRAAPLAPEHAEPVPLACADVATERELPAAAPAGSVLRGRVVGLDGTPLAGAELHASPTRWAYYRSSGCTSRSYSPGDDVLPDEWARFADAQLEPAVSDADGRFVLPAPGAHNLTLYARADGFALTRRRGVAPGAEDLEVTLTPAARLSVEVRDALTGATLCDVELRAFRQLHDAGRSHEHELAVLPPPSARDDRCYTVLDTGTLATELELSAPGYARRFVRVAGQAPGSMRREVVELQPGARLEGRALLPDGEPAANAIVRLEHADIQRWRVDARTDDSGAFSFDQLPAGVVTLGRVEGWGVPGPTRRVELSAGERLTGVIVQRAARASLEGVLRTGDGSPVAFHWVRLELVDDPSRSDWSRVEETDAHGAFRYAAVPPGTLELSADGSDARLIATLDPGARQHVELVLPGSPRVTGTVRENGAPVPHAMVRLWAADADGPLGSFGVDAVADAHGRYELLVPSPGTYHVGASRDENSWDLSAVRALTLVADARASHDIEFGGHSISGHVREHRDGEALKNVQLLLTAPQLAEPFETGTADDGSFRFTGLPPGEYTLDLRFTERYVGLLEPRVITLPDGAPTQVSVELEMCRGARLEGSAFTPGGLPVQDGVPVAALLLDPEPPPPKLPRTLGSFDSTFYREPSHGIWAGTSTEDGRYALFGLPEGRYAVLAGSAAATAAEVRARGTRVWLAEHGTHALMLEAVGDD